MTSQETAFMYVVGPFAEQLGNLLFSKTVIG